MGFAAATWIGLVALCAAAVPGCTIESYDEPRTTGVIADFEVTSEQEHADDSLTKGCFLVLRGEGGFGIDDHDKADEIKIRAKPGTRVKHTVRFYEISKYDRSGGLPDDDELWCGEESNAGARTPSGYFAFDCKRVIGPDPAATIESIDLIDPQWDETSKRIFASGYTLTLVVEHPGTVRTVQDCGSDVSKVIPPSYRGDQVAELTILAP